MLIVNRHALIAVHLLYLGDEVLLCFLNALDLDEFLRIARTIDDGIACSDFLSVSDLETSETRNDVGLFGAVVSNNRDDTTLAFVFTDSNNTSDARERRLALRAASFEQFNNAWQTAGEVGTSNTAGVEGTHGELSARFTNRLRSDNANGLANFDQLARCQRKSVTRCRNTEIGIVGQRRKHTNASDTRIVTQKRNFVVADDGALGENGAIGKRDIVSKGAAEETSLEPCALTGTIGLDVFDPNAADRTT